MFHSARLKLTAWYLLIITCISITFSVVIYREVGNEVERFDRAQRIRFERRLELGQPVGAPALPVPPNPELVDESEHRTLIILIIINSSIILASGILGYILAGETLKPIKEMMDEQNRFISDASHELRTPLTSLISAFEVYLRQKNRKIKDADILVQESVDEAHKLQSLSESLLQLAQYQKPNDAVTFEKISLDSVIQQSINKLAPVAVQKNVTLSYSPKSVDIDGSKYGLIDLFVILLDNAVKYSASGSIVTISVKKTDDSVVVNVEDHGIGVHEKDLPHIFDRFYRADAARQKTRTGGYGLGLSIAQKIVRAHNGSIDVKSVLHKGSTFSVRLPVHQVSSMKGVSLFS